MRQLAGKSLLALAAALSIMVCGCGQPGTQNDNPVAAQSPSPAQAQEKRFHLKGTVVSLDRPHKHVVINHEAIPGFMEAMTMPYPVVDDKTLDMLTPGDQITADVVVTNDGIHLDNVVVVKKSDGKSQPGTQLQQKQIQEGEQVPNFA